MGDSHTTNTPPPPLPPPHKPLPPRVAARPLQSMWSDEETLTFRDAAALFFPYGPLTERSFRTAAKNGSLTWVKVNRKLLTTVAWVKDMLTPKPVPPPSAPTSVSLPKPAPGESILPPGPGRPAATKSQQKLAAAFARSAIRR